MEEYMKNVIEKYQVTNRLWFLILATGLLLSSCNPQVETADLFLQIEHQLASSSRTATPETSLEISFYQVTGNGPDGEAFEMESDQAQITVPGLLLGDWQISVIGFSDENVGLSQGESVVTLSKSESSSTIVTSEFYGTGSASVTAEWDDSQIIDASLHAQVSLSGGTETPEELTPTATASGSASFQLDDYPAGAYLLRIKLYSEGVLTGGAAEIIRIVDGKTTHSDLQLDFNDLLMGMKLTVIDSYSKPISGSITGIPLTAMTDSPVSVSFTPDPDMAWEDYVCMWYADGTLHGTGNPIDYTPKEGIQRLDVVVSTADKGSDGTASQLVEGVSGIEPGTPLLYRSYKPGNDSGIKVDGISDIEVLPDGKIVIISSIDDSLQILSIINDELMLDQTFTSDGLATLDGAARLSVSENGEYIAALSDNDQSVTIFTYNQSTQKADFMQSLLSTGAGEVSYDIGKIGSAAFSADGTTLIVSDRSDNTLVQFSLGQEMFSCTGSFNFSSYEVIDDPRSIGFLFDDFVLATASSGNNTLYIMEGLTTDQPMIRTYLNSDETGTNGLSGVHTIEKVHEKQFITLSQDTLSEFIIDGTQTSYGIQQDSRHKETTHVPVPFRPKDVTVTSNGDSVYAVTSTGNGIVKFTRESIGSSLSYDSFVSTDPITPNSCKATADDQYLLVGASTDDRLLLYRYAQ
jgi:6-phosphogluconolactonase (cycloisomerase 2 family)